MLHDMGISEKVNHIYERAVRIASQDLLFTLEELLITDDPVSNFINEIYSCI